MRGAAAQRCLLGIVVLFLLFKNKNVSEGKIQLISAKAEAEARA